MAYTRTYRENTTRNGTMGRTGAFGTGYGFINGVVRTGTRSGSRVPNHRQVIRNGQNATSNYDTVRYRLAEATPLVSYLDAYWPTDANYKGTKSYRGYPGLNQTFESLATPPENAALSRAYSKLREHRTEMNGALFFGELRESVRMLRSPATALVRGLTGWVNDSVRLVKRNPDLLRKKNRQRLADTLTGTYLEGMFGWTPLISDVKDIATTIARLQDENTSRNTRVTSSSRAQGRSVEYLASADPQASDSYVPISTAGWNRIKSTDASSQWILYLHHSLSSTAPPGSFSRIASLSGFTAENVVPTIYNLIPYSFLLDYVSNLGDCVEAIFTDQSNIRFAVRTNRTIDTVSVDSIYSAAMVRQVAIANGWAVRSVSGSSGRVVEIRTTLSRRGYPVLPTPVLEFNLPNSPWKYGNMLALAIANAKRVFS